MDGKGIQQQVSCTPFKAHWIQMPEKLARKGPNLALEMTRGSVLPQLIETFVTAVEVGPKADRDGHPQWSEKES